MSILAFVIAILVLAFILYLINYLFTNLEPGIKRFLNVVAVLLFAFWFLNELGLLHWLQNTRISK